MMSISKHRILTLSILILISFIFINCAPLFWIKKYRDMPDIDEDPRWNYNDKKDRRTIKSKNESLEDYYVDHYGERNNPKFTARPIEIDESKFTLRNEVNDVVMASSDTSYSGVKLTFIHLSDTQLRDEQVRLYDRKTSRLADYVIPSFEHEARVEAFDGAAYYAIIQTIKATVYNYDDGDPRRPIFMIHTGDAIDAGVINELYEFIYISNEARIPWYNAIGNHDVGTFGNIEQKMIYVNNPFVDFMTMHSKFNFINMHDNAYEYYPFVNVAPTNTGLDTTIQAGRNLFSKYNGFDRLKYTPEEINDYGFICRDCPGYYSIEVKKGNDANKDPGVQMIVLDTGFSFGAQGEIGDEQLTWLKKEIRKADDKIILVFGHHNIDEIKQGKNELIKILAKNTLVIAYLCGHTHYHDINYYPGEGNSFGFWEVITDAIYAYPQQGSVVRIKYERGVGFLDIYAFRHTIQREYGKEGSKQESELFVHSELSYEGALEDATKRQRETEDKDRYARLRFPYPRLM